MRLADLSGTGSGEPYRLTLREPRPDFRVSVTPRNPNVPAGSGARQGYCHAAG